MIIQTSAVKTAEVFCFKRRLVKVLNLDKLHKDLRHLQNLQEFRNPFFNCLSLGKHIYHEFSITIGQEV